MTSPTPEQPATPDSSRPSRRRFRKRWAFGPLLLLVALYLVHHLVAEVGWTDLLARVRTARPGPLVLAALFLVGHLWMWGYRWKLAIRRVDSTPRRRIIYSALAAAASINLMAPFARILGGLLRARYVARAGQYSVAAFYGGVLFDQAVHFVVMTTITLLAMVGGLALAGRDLAATALGVAAALLIAGFFFWQERLTARGPAALARYLAQLGERRHGFVSRLLTRGKETLDMLARLLADRSLRFQSAAIGVVVFLMTAAAQGLVFEALGLRPGVMVVLVSVALSTAAGTIVGTPGGLGATEAAMIALYVALDVQRIDAAAAALLFRALYYIVVLAVGVPATAFLELGMAKRRRRGRNAS